MLLRRFSKCSTPVKCYLFKTYCYNLFCASLWYKSTLTAIKKLPITTALDDYFAYLNITVLAKCVYKYVWTLCLLASCSENIYTAFVLD